jgi:hypothetical protein
MIVRKIAPTLALLCISISAALAATPDTLTEQEQAKALVAAEAWSFNGGEATLRFNTSLLELYGVTVSAPGDVLTHREHDAVSAVMPIRQEAGIRFAARDGSLTRFVDGELRIDGRFNVTLPDGGRLDYDGFTVRVSPVNPMHLDVIGNDGKVWFYVNHMMWETIDDNTRFHLRAADLNATNALAARIGVPELAGTFVGELKFISPLVTRGPGQMGAPTFTDVDRNRGQTPCVRGATPCFHGDLHPDGGIYEADVLMQSYSMSFSRCRGSSGTGSCDGNGPDDGEVVFTPSSTLRNTNNANTADVPWHEKFFPFGSTNPWGYPYPNADQHPYLIWNMYRIVDDQLEQIAASGVKHAWLTTNTGCSAPFGGHILSPNCSDTYGTGNNDAPDDLGPRNELDPAAGWWGRCGSIFDTDCNGLANSVSSSGYRDRLIVRESQLSVPGATYYSDSWYIVQDDINIYNTMMHRTMSPTPGSSGWSPGSQGSNVVGPLINAWVNPVANPTRNVELASDEGHTRVAVKTKELASCPAGSGLSGTCWRYDYAVHNFDFARIVTGAAPNDLPPNLRILSNKGFQSFTIPVGAAGVYVDPTGHFADIDIDPANNWTVSTSGGAVTWTAPDGNELNWGTLFRFSLVSNVAPDADRVAALSLGVAGPGTPASLEADIMVPGSGAGPVEFQVTATAGAGGDIDPAAQTVASGGTATFTVTADVGFDVVSVEGDTCTPVDGGAGTWTAANIVADCAVLATFKSNNDIIFQNGFEVGANVGRPVP